MIFSISAILLLRWYASFKAKLLKADASETEIRKALNAGLTAVSVYVVAVIVCFFNTTAAIGVYILTPFLYLFTQLKTRN